MKKILALLLFALIAAIPSRAGVTCSVPFQLQNSTTADATQVMANYNALIACLASAAAAGANNDITSLAAISTPITNTQGGTPVYLAGTSTGSANAQAVSVTPGNFSLTAGYQVTFTAGFGNTGAMTLNVAGSGATNVFRRTQFGISATVGGEIIAGHSVTVRYDGTQFQLISGGPYMVGEIRDYGPLVAPLGWAFIDGSCQLRAGIFADLFNLAIGTVYDPTGSTCDVAHFALPDGRGRVLAGLDTMGVNGAANRITAGGSGCSGNVAGGAGCGLQNHTQTLAELVSHNHGITDPTHFHTGVLRSSGNTPNGGVTPGGNNLVGTNSFNTDGATTGITINNAGGGTAMPILNPLQIVTKIIKL